MQVYVHIYIHSQGPWAPGPAPLSSAARPVMCPRDLCAAGAAPASAAQRKRWSACDWGAPRPSAQRDSRAGALSARDPGRQKNERAHWAHWVGSAYRGISLLRLGRSFLSRPREGRACNPHEVRAQASEQPHTVRTDRGVGRRADWVRRTWRGLSGLQSGSRRAGRSDPLPLQCDGESGVHSPFR